MPRKDLPFIDVYFPEPGGEQQKIRWEEEAKKERLSRAAFIREAVEFYLRETDSSRPPRVDPKLQEENQKLREDLKLRALALEKAETDLFRLRNAVFLERQGQSPMNVELLDLLKTGTLWTADKLLEALGVSPRDVEATRIISRQLQILQAAGMITETTRGWRWKA